MNALDEPLVARDGTIALWGYGVSVTVSRGQLVLSDGIADARRTVRLSRAERPRRIVVVVEAAGHVSLDAVRWLTVTQSSSLVLLSRAGVVLAAIGPRRLDDAKLRRNQAIAPWTDAGGVVAAMLLAAKLAGQAFVLRTLEVPQAVARAVAACEERIHSAESIGAMLVAESDAAVWYWRELAQLEVRFASRSVARVPAHWHRFGQRQSPIARGNRRAVTPANAMLNYAYAILEAEVTIALAAVGLDPGLGVMHADVEGRASFALDVLEAVRPEADRAVLELLAKRSFSHEDFVELEAGDVRLAPAIATELAQRVRFEKIVSYIVSQVVRSLESPRAQLALPPLHASLEAEKDSLVSVAPIAPSRPRRSGTLRVRDRDLEPRKKPKPLAIAVRCVHCGEPIAKRRRPHVCAACRPAHDAGELQRMTTRIVSAAAAARTRTAASGATHRTDASVAKQRIASSRMKRERDAWTDDGSLDGVDFDRDVRPGLQRFSVMAIGRAIGASRAWGAKIRSGNVTPHRRHWRNLIELSLTSRAN